MGHKTIAACAKDLGAAASPVEIGKRLKCGTNCGSCVPEIQAIIQEARRGDVADAGGEPAQSAKS